MSSVKQKAIAMLLTLSMLSLVLLLVVDVNEYTSQELELITNENNLFHLERESIVVLKAVTTALLLYGANNLYYSLKFLYPDKNIKQILIIDWPDIEISNLDIKGIDHYFYINRVNYNFSTETTQGQLNIFRNVINNFAIKNDVKIRPQQVNEFIGSLADWIDEDDLVTNNNFLLGKEEFPQSIPIFNTKNARLDSLTELYLIPSFQNLNILNQDQIVFDLPLRIHPLVDPINQCDIGPLNLNMLTTNEDEAKEVLSKYISWSEGVILERCGYQELIQNSFRIIELIAEAVNEKDLPPFRTPLSSDTLWEEITENLGTPQIKSKLVGLFTSRSDLVEVRYSLHVKDYVVPFILILELNYINSSSEIPNSVVIKYYGRI